MGEQDLDHFDDFSSITPIVRNEPQNLEQHERRQTGDPRCGESDSELVAAAVEADLLDLDGGEQLSEVVGAQAQVLGTLTECRLLDRVADEAVQREIGQAVPGQCGSVEQHVDGALLESSDAVVDGFGGREVVVPDLERIGKGDSAVGQPDRDLA